MGEGGVKGSFSSKIIDNKKWVGYIRSNNRLSIISLTVSGKCDLIEHVKFLVEIIKWRPISFTIRRQPSL